jgi:hypothetical protein
MKLRLLLGCGAALVLALCGPNKVYHPYDPENPDYRDPGVQFSSGPENGETVASDSVRVSWKGNEKETRTRYRLGDRPWSSFSDRSSASFTHLDDGEYTLEVEARYEGWTDTETYTLSFSVAALESVSCYLFPMRSAVDLSDGYATVSLRTRGLPACNALEFSIEGATIDTAMLADSLEGGDVVLLADSETLNLLFLDDPRAIEGARSLLTLRLRPDGSGDSSRITLTGEARFGDGDTATTVDVAQFRGGLLLREK